jgi:hypothetical protein
LEVIERVEMEALPNRQWDLKLCATFQWFSTCYDAQTAERAVAIICKNNTNWAHGLICENLIAAQKP